MLTGTVIDPCEPSVLTVTMTALTDQVYYISDVPLAYPAPAFAANESWCVLTYSFSVSDAALNPAIIFDSATRTFTVDYSADLALSGTTSMAYTVTMTATRSGVSDSADFTLTMVNPCDQPGLSTIVTPVSPMDPINVYVGAPR